MNEAVDPCSRSCFPDSGPRMGTPGNGPFGNCRRLFHLIGQTARPFSAPVPFEALVGQPRRPHAEKGVCRVGKKGSAGTSDSFGARRQNSSRPHVPSWFLALGFFRKSGKSACGNPRALATTARAENSGGLPRRFGIRPRSPPGPWRSPRFSAFCGSDHSHLGPALVL